MMHGQKNIKNFYMYNLRRCAQVYDAMYKCVCCADSAFCISQIEDVSVEFGVLVVLSITLEVSKTAVKSLCDVHTQTQKQRNMLVIRYLFEHAAP
jgi:hypothetical protein